MRIATLLALVAVTLTGCGAPSEPERAPAQERESVFEPLTETLDRAESVEDTLREQSDDLRRRVDEAEQ